MWQHAGDARMCRYLLVGSEYDTGHNGSNGSLETTPCQPALALGPSNAPRYNAVGSGTVERVVDTLATRPEYCTYDQ